MVNALRVVAACGVLWPVIVSAQNPPDDRERAHQAIVAARVRTAEGARTIDVPVDSSVSSLIVSTQSLPGIDVALLRPGGARVGEADADVEVSALTVMDLDLEVPANLRMYTVARPQTGVWQVAISASQAATPSTVLVEAHGDSPIAFGSFEFVRHQAGVHGGYFRIDGAPLAGAPATARARQWRGPAAATFRLVGVDGGALRNLPLRKGHPDTGDDEFLGTFDLPAVAFHVVMNAVDEAGAPIQRHHRATFRAQPVALFFDYGMSDVIKAGTPRRLAFAVTNVGAEPASFTLDVTTTVGEVRDLSPRVVLVQPGTSATASFVLAVPAKTERSSGIDVHVTAMHTSDASVKNHVSVDLELAREHDADNDFVEDGQDNCPEMSNADQRDTNRNGTGDVCDPAGEGPLSIRSMSPESGPPGTVVTIAGTGFSATGPNFVVFDGMPALAVLAGAAELQVTVPAGAAPGPIRLVVGTTNGIGMAPKPFIVRKP